MIKWDSFLEREYIGAILDNLLSEKREFLAESFVPKALKIQT